MKKIVRRLVDVARAVLRILRFASLAGSGALATAGIIALKHLLETPQALESPLPGEARLYKWQRGHIFYKVQEAADAPPLLLLHTPELAGSAYEMRQVMSPLAERYRVYAPDLIGFGLSDRPHIDYTADTYITLCRDFLREVVGQPATIVASRISCNYAVVIAATSPELCSGLALISPLALHGNRPGHLRLERVLPAKIIEAPVVKALLYPLLVALTGLRARLRQASIAGQPQAGAPLIDTGYYYATTHQFGAEHAVMALLAGKLARDVMHEIEMVQQPALLIWETKALDQAWYIKSEQDLTWAPVHTQMVLLQDAETAAPGELPQTVAATIKQWDGEKKTAIAQPQTSAETNAAKGEQAAVEQQQPADQPAEVTIEAYCVKCKTKRTMLHPREVTMKNGRIGIQGTCSVCGTSLFRIGRLVPGYPQAPV